MACVRISAAYNSCVVGQECRAAILTSQSFHRFSKNMPGGGVDEVSQRCGRSATYTSQECWCCESLVLVAGMRKVRGAFFQVVPGCSSVPMRAFPYQMRSN